MSNNIELLSKTEFFTIGANNNLSEILANVVKVGTDSSNVTISIPQNISSSYNLTLPFREGEPGELLVYGNNGQLSWEYPILNDPPILKQIISVYGPNLIGNFSPMGSNSEPIYLDEYEAIIYPKSKNSKIFVQFKINYYASLSESNQISFYIKKSYDDNETVFSESLFGPYNGTGGFTGQYISNLVDEALSSNKITYKLGYKINGSVLATDVLGILGYDKSYNNTIVLQEFEGSGSNTISVWNKGSDNNGLYYNEGTVHIGSSKNALESQNIIGVALELSGNLLGTNANFSQEVNTNIITANDGYFNSSLSLLSENTYGNKSVTLSIANDISNSYNLILPNREGINGEVLVYGNNGQLLWGNLVFNQESFIDEVNANVIRANAGYFSSIISLLTDNDNSEKSVSLSISEDISNSYNLILPIREGITGETLVYGSDGQLIWEDSKLRQETFVYINGNNNQINYLNSSNTYNLYSWIEMRLEKVSIGAPQLEFFTDTDISKDNKTLIINSNGIEINTKNNETITLGTINGNTSLSASNNLIIDSSNGILFNINDNNLLIINGNKNIDINSDVKINGLLNHKGTILNEIEINSTSQITYLPLDSVIKVEKNLTLTNGFITFLTSNQFLVGGSYLIQLYITNDQSDSYYTGLMSWPDTVPTYDSESIKEINLHTFFPITDGNNNTQIKLQTKTIIGSTELELQIANYNIESSNSNFNFIFKARKFL
jgi:hypothetical protein